MRDSPESTVRTYLAIWVWLAGLMILGVVLSEMQGLHIAKHAVVKIVVGLSTIKATLVALYYMHLKMDRRLLTWILLAPFTIIVLALGVIFSSHLVRL